jgi:hypothetical protein
VTPSGGGAEPGPPTIVFDARTPLEFVGRWKLLVDHLLKFGAILCEQVIGTAALLKVGDDGPHAPEVSSALRCCPTSRAGLGASPVREHGLA